jgi:branched-chain amino acid transport system substrate-binding protein
MLSVLGGSLAAPTIVRAQDTSPITIGGMLPLSGPGAIEGRQVLKGLEFAVKEANEKGGALGRQIKLVLEDDESNSTKGVTAVRRLIEREKVPFIVGTYPTAVVMAAMKVAAEYKVPMLSGGSTGAGATDANTPGDPWFFRCWPDSNAQGRDTADAILKRFNGTRIGIIHDTTNYGVTLADQVTKLITSGGGNVLTRDSFTLGEQDFSSMLTRLRGLKPDVLYVAGWAGDGANIVRQAYETGLRVQFIGSGSMQSDDFIRLAGPAAEGFAVATQFEPTTPNAFGRAFGERFKAAHKEEANSLNALGFDSTNIGIEALRRAGKPDGLAIQGMLKTGMKDFKIVQGPDGQTAAFDEKGSVNYPFFIAIVKNGRRTL